MSPQALSLRLHGAACGQCLSSPGAPCSFPIHSQSSPDEVRKDAHQRALLSVRRAFLVPRQYQHIGEVRDETRID